MLQRRAIQQHASQTWYLAPCIIIQALATEKSHEAFLLSHRVMCSQKHKLRTESVLNSSINSPSVKLRNIGTLTEEV